MAVMDVMDVMKHAYANGHTGKSTMFICSAKNNTFSVLGIPISK